MNTLRALPIGGFEAFIAQILLKVKSDGLE